MMFPNFIVPALQIISEIIVAFGITLLIYAVLLTVYRTIKTETAKDKKFNQYEHTKRILTQKMILALDFFVAADLIQLALVSSLSEILSIAFIVAIRTVLSWSLGKEVHLHKE